jgi:hypothetical protein
LWANDRNRGAAATHRPKVVQRLRKMKQSAGFLFLYA